MKKTVLAILFYSLVLFAHSQCAVGETSIVLNIVTDPWPYETYWEIVPAGNGCGNGTIVSGSNMAVGCSGADGGVDTSYPASTIVTSGDFCLVTGESYDLLFVDSYGDGGLNFELMQDGIQTNQFFGSGTGNTWTFEAGVFTLDPGDTPCSAFEVVPDGGVVEFNNTNATAGFTEPSPPAGGCIASGYWCEGAISNTVWAYFVADSGQSYEITTCNSEGSFDTQIAVYKSIDCSDYIDFELVGANDDFIYGCGLTDNYASTCWVSCLVPGATYYIQIDGWNGTTGTTHLSVNSYSGNVEMQTVVENIDCPLDKGQSADGSIQPYLIGEGANFTCTWTGPNNFSSTENAVYDLGPGVYDLELTSPCGQTFSSTYEIIEPSPWNVTITTTEPDCSESADGSVNLDVAGATTPYSYSWTSFNYSSSDEDAINLNSGTYNLVITDANGCTYPQTLVLEPADNFSFDLGNDTTMCSTDELLVYAPSGLIYLWQDGSTNQFYQINAEDWNIGSNALILTAQTNEGCIYTDAFVFNVDDCTAIEESVSNSVFGIYPNPVNGAFTITSKNDMSSAVIQIYNAIGELVYLNNSLNGVQTSVHPDLTPGYYLAVISDQQDQQFIPLIRN